MIAVLIYANHYVNRSLPKVEEMNELESLEVEVMITTVSRSNVWLVDGTYHETKIRNAEGQKLILTPGK